jgi:hypothetical protein
MVEQEGNERNIGKKSSGLRLRLDNIIEGMEMQSDTVASYLNKVTGEIVPVSDEAISAVDMGDEDPLTGESLDIVRAVLNSEDYIQLPDHYEINEYSMMESFAFSLADQSAGELLLITIRGAGAFRRFKDTARHLGLIENWYEYRARAYTEVAREWCETHGITYDCE